MFHLSSRSKERLTGVHPDLITIIYEAIKLSPVDFGIPKDGGKRTQLRQNNLYQKGVSKCDGFDKKSNHQTGNAFDIYIYINGGASWDKKLLSLAAGCILSTATKLKKEGKISIDLNWGGTFGSDTFNGWDMPHFEIAEG